MFGARQCVDSGAAATPKEGLILLQCWRTKLNGRTNGTVRTVPFIVEGD